MKLERKILAAVCGTLVLCMAVLMGCLHMGKARDTRIEYVIGVSLANLREQWRLVLKDELEAEAAKYESVRLVILDAAGDSEKQAADVKRLMGFGADLLIISPGDVEAVTPVIREVYEEIPVIVLDRVAEGFDYSLFIGPDNSLIGRQAGEVVLDLIKEDMAEDGTVLEIKTDSFANKSRSEEFLRTISDAGIRYQSLVLPEATRDCAEDVLLAEPELLEDVSVIFAHNDYMAYGAHLALEKLSVSGVSIVGLDGFAGENGGLQMVEEGIIDATVTCPTGGSEAVRYAIDIINKENGIPKQIMLRSHKIRQDNLAQYQKNDDRPLKEQETIRVGYAQIDEESNWRKASIESIQKAARESGIDLQVEFNVLSLEEQIAQVRKFIAQDMDVIVISPLVTEGWQDILKEAKVAGIPVLLVDRTVSVDEELYESYIGADFEEEGRRCARWLLQQTEDMEKVSVLELRGTEGASPAKGRKDGFESVIAGDERCTIVFSDCGDFNREGGAQIIRNYMEENEWDIDAVFAHNDEMALGAIEVLKEYGIVPGTDVKLMSVDGTADALTALQKGELNCVVECNPLLGPELMKAITDLMNGKELPLRIITDEVVFTEGSPEEYFENRRY